MRKKYLDGSYTIEAALIVPIVIFIIISIIYYSFYLHDSLVMKSCGYGFVLDYENYSGLGEEELSEKARNLLDERTILAQNISADVDLKNNGMEIYYSGSFSFPFIGLREILENNISDINRSTKVKSISKSDFIRGSKVAKDALDLE